MAEKWKQIAMGTVISIAGIAGLTSCENKNENGVKETRISPIFSVEDIMKKDPYAFADWKDNYSSLSKFVGKGVKSLMEKVKGENKLKSEIEKSGIPVELKTKDGKVYVLNNVGAIHKEDGSMFYFNPQYREKTDDDAVSHFAPTSASTRSAVVDEATAILLNQDLKGTGLKIGDVVKIDGGNYKIAPDGIGAGTEWDIQFKYPENDDRPSEMIPYRYAIGNPNIHLSLLYGKSYVGVFGSAQRNDDVYKDKYAIVDFDTYDFETPKKPEEQVSAKQSRPEKKEPPKGSISKEAFIDELLAQRGKKGGRK